LSGTDYNQFSENDKVNLRITLKHFRKFKQDLDFHGTFYEWLDANSDYINNVDLLNKINDMFTLDTNHANLDQFKNIKIVNGPKIQSDIEDIMREEDFIFVKTT
jgi:hypothetical protein